MTDRLTSGEAPDQMAWASGVSFLAGVWLIVSAFMFEGLAAVAPYAGRWNTLIVGSAVMILAAWRLWRFDQPILSWINTVLGVWLIAAPFVLGHTDNVSRTWNNLIVGTIVVMFASASASVRPAWSRASYDVRRLGDAEGREGVGPFCGVGPRGWRRTDAQILDLVADRMADDPHLDASRIEIAVSNAEVTLTGCVATRAAKRRAEDVAESAERFRRQVVLAWLRTRQRRRNVRSRRRKSSGHGRLATYDSSRLLRCQLEMRAR